MKLFILHWVPVFIYALIIFSISSLPSTSMPGSGGIDLSFFHVAEYFILSYLIFRALETKTMNNNKRVFIAILFAFLYGVTDEVHQIYVPGRSFDFLDMFFNFIGSSLILYKIMNRK